MQPAIEQVLAQSSLLAAWEKVRANQGAPGVDGVTLDRFEDNLHANLTLLRKEVQQHSYRPLPLLRVEIPKRGGGMRPLSIPAVRDRVLQTAVATALTPLFETQFEDTSFAYRRGHSVEQAVARVEQLREQGYRWVVDADIRAFFDQVNHKRLLAEVERLVNDEEILWLIRHWIRAEVQDRGSRYRLKKGIPQGSPLSPLLANLYLDRLDDTLLDADHHLVRFADDFLVLCRNRDQAEEALELTESTLRALRLELHSDKTRITHFDKGFRFLGVQFIRSLAVKLEHPEDPAEPPAVRPPSPDGEKSPPQPQTPMAAALAEAGIEPDDFPPAPRPLPLPPDHSLDPRLRTLYLLRHGQVLGKAGERLVIRQQGREEQEIPIIKVDQVMIFGNAQITTQAMQLCLHHRVPIYLLSATGRYHGVVDSFDTDPVLLQQAQFRRADDPGFCLELARALLDGKLANSRTLLKRLARNRAAPHLTDAAQQIQRLRAHLAQAETLDQARGFEGAAARLYFEAMQQLLDPQWKFTGRNRQPPRDPVNALLSYGYTLLFYNIYSLIRARGLNPHVGYLHPLRAGHPALASDLMEEFRALVVDPVVWNLVLNQRLQPDQFRLPRTPGDACRMDGPARTRLIRDLEKKLNASIVHPNSGLRLDYRRCMEHQIDELAGLLRGSRHRYRPMIVR